MILQLKNPGVFPVSPREIVVYLGSTSFKVYSKARALSNYTFNFNFSSGVVPDRVAVKGKA